MFYLPGEVDGELPPRLRFLVLAVLRGERREESEQAEKKPGYYYPGKARLGVGL